MGLFDESGALIAGATARKAISRNWLKVAGALRRAHGADYQQHGQYHPENRPCVVLATRKYVDDKALELKVYGMIRWQNILPHRTRIHSTRQSQPDIYRNPQSANASGGE